MNIIFLLKHKSTVTFINEGCTVKDGADILRTSGYTAIPVVDNDGKYAGTVTEGDFLWFILGRKNHPGASLKNMADGVKVSDIIRPEYCTPVSITATMDDLLLLVMQQNFVPVVDDRNVFMGIITRRDVLQYYRNMENNELAGGNDE